MNDQFNPQSMPTITRLSGLKYKFPVVKFSDKTNIRLDLKDAFKILDIIRYLRVMALETGIPLDSTDYQLLNSLIKKLKNASPEMQF